MVLHLSCAFWFRSCRIQASTKYEQQLRAAVALLYGWLLLPPRLNFVRISRAMRVQRYQSVWTKLGQLLPANWLYTELDEEGTQLHFRSAARQDYIVSIGFAKGVLSKENKRLETSTTALADEINMHRKKLLRTAKARRAKAVMLLPNASSPEWNDWVSLHAVIYFCDLSKLTEWFDFRDRPKLEEEEAKRWGREVEKEAQQEVQLHKPANWQLWLNQPLDCGGDADIVLELPEKKRIVVDVKSYRGTLRAEGFSLIRADGVYWNEVAESAKRQARELKALPIVWAA